MKTKKILLSLAVIGLLAAGCAEQTNQKDSQMLPAQEQKNPGVGKPNQQMENEHMDMKEGETMDHNMATSTLNNQVMQK